MGDRKPYGIPRTDLFILIDQVLASERQYARSVGPEKYFEYINSNPPTCLEGFLRDCEVAERERPDA
jgi:hypothetical protein